MHVLIDWILDRPRTGLALIVALTAVLGVGATGVRIEDSVESMLLQDDPDRAYYQHFLERFGSDELVVVAAHARRPLAPETLEAIERLGDALGAIARPGADGEPELLVDEVLSLATVERITSRPHAESGESELVIEPWLREPPRSAGERRALLRELLADPLTRGKLVATGPGDGAEPFVTHLIFARVPYREGDLGYRRSVQDAVEEIVAGETERGAFAELRVTGSPMIKAALGRTAQEDLAVLVPISWIAIFGLLLLLFREWRAVAISMGVVSLAVVWTVGLLTLCGSYLNVASAITLPLIEVIGVITSIHLLDRYYEDAPAVREPLPLLRGVLATMAWPTFLASFTTAVGFLALAVSRIVPIREVGLYSALGVMSAWILAMVLVPAALRSVEPPRERPRSRLPLGMLAALPEAVGRQRRPILLVSTLLLALGVAGIPRVRVETDVLRFLAPDHPDRVSEEFVNERVGGVHPLEITLRTPPGELLEPALLRRIDRLQHWLERQPHIGATLSFVDSVKSLHQHLNDGSPAFQRVPETREQVAAELLLAEGEIDLSPFLQPHWQAAEEARIALRLDSIQSAELTDLIGRVEARLAAELVSDPSLVVRRSGRQRGLTGIAPLDSFLGDLAALVPGSVATSDGEERVLESGQVSARLTGVNRLYGAMVDELVEGQISSLLVALVFVGLTILAVTRSPATAVLAMIPNVLPVILILGLMGWLGITLNLGTALVGAICLGIAVDDTLLFLARFRMHRGRGAATEAAVAATLREIGRPIVYTSVALAAGFGCYTFSVFAPHASFGLLASLTILFALAGDLFLLPALLLGADVSAAAAKSERAVSLAQGRR